MVYMTVDSVVPGHLFPPSFSVEHERDKEDDMGGGTDKRTETVPNEMEILFMYFFFFLSFSYLVFQLMLLYG